MGRENNDVILQVNNLRISFRAYGGLVKAVRGVSFDLKRGETVAVVGESGSGKSVSIKAIMGILPPNAIIEEGEILYDGKDLIKVGEEDFHKIRGKRIGLIFQDPLSALNPIMKVGNQITEALRLSKKMTKREAKDVALDLMNAVGIPCLLYTSSFCGISLMTKNEILTIINRVMNIATIRPAIYFAIVTSPKSPCPSRALAPL